VRRRAIPLADAASFRAAARITRILRFGLAVALVAAVAGAAASAERLNQRQHGLFQPGTSGVVVLDLSQSISTENFEKIGTTLSALIAAGGQSGLVVFSNDAYEVLPPGTPTRELRPLLRYFEFSRRPAPGEAPDFPINPWSRRFTAGTHISTGLELAREVIERDHIRRPSILLVSDLADDAADLPAVSGTIIALRRAQIPLRIVGLNPYPGDLRYFESLVGPGAAEPVQRPDGRRLEAAAATLTTRFPGWLVVFACMTIVLLAANELWLVRVPYGRGAEHPL
jgi:hypothetical protein